MAFYELSVRKIKELEQIVKEKYGIVLSNFATIPLRRKIEKSLSFFNLNSIEELITIVNSDKIGKEDFLLSLSSVATEMFRAPSVWRFLLNEFSKTVAENNNYRIWFPLCAGGYELFSLITLLKILDVEEKVEITINCLSTEKSNLLKRGEILIDKKILEISKLNFKRFGIKPHYDWESIFYENDERLIFKEKIKTKIKITKEGVFMPPPFMQDIVVYRNIMLDYTLKYSYEIIGNIVKKLKKGGLLIIGEKEKILYLQEYSLSAINENDGIYKKK